MSQDLSKKKRVKLASFIISTKDIKRIIEAIKTKIDNDPISKYIKVGTRISNPKTHMPQFSNEWKIIFDTISTKGGINKARGYLIRELFPSYIQAHPWPTLLQTIEMMAKGKGKIHLKIDFTGHITPDVIFNGEDELVKTIPYFQEQGFRDFSISARGSYSDNVAYVYVDFVGFGTINGVAASIDKLTDEDVNIISNFINIVFNSYFPAEVISDPNMYYRTPFRDDVETARAQRRTPEGKWQEWYRKGYRGGIHL